MVPTKKNLEQVLQARFARAEEEYCENRKIT